MSRIEHGYRRIVVEPDHGPEPRADEPRNVLLFVGSHFLTKLGDALSSPKTTLTWLATGLGVPGWMTALLVPLRESGSMLVQVGLAGVVQRFAQRKWVWSLGALLQALSMLGIALCALWLRGYAAGIVLLALLAIFALSRSLSSVASKDVLGRTVPRSRRGRVTGWAASAAGIATLALGGAVIAFGPPSLAPGGFAVVIAGAGALWLVAAALFTGIREPGADGTSRDADTRLRMLLRDRRLRRFIMARAMLMCTALAAPYFVMLAHRQGDTGPRMLALFITVQGVAAMLGGPLWGRLADRSSRRVMLVGGLAAAVLACGLAVAAQANAGVLRQAWFMPAMYFLLSLTHQAVRIGRKTYVVDMATGNTRTDYVAISNSAIGVLLLVAGGLVAALSACSTPAALGLLAVMGAVGALLCARLPRVAAAD